MKIVGLKEGATLTSEVGIYTRIRDVARPQPNNLIYDNSSNPGSQRHLMEDGLQFTRAGVGRLALVLVTMVIMSLRRGETCRHLAAGRLLRTTGSPRITSEQTFLGRHCSSTESHTTTTCMSLARLHIHDLPRKILVQPGPWIKRMMGCGFGSWGQEVQ